jgi:CheY-like chemotaxis protein
MKEGNKTILIVDDESDIITWLSVLLKENGYRIVTATDGVEGFAAAKAVHPDLITLDLAMDKETGIKMYGRLLSEKETADIPVIMLTGLTSQIEGFIARMRGKKPPAAFLEKPVSEERLLSKIRELIG